jgi:hypothetical protein
MKRLIYMLLLFVVLGHTVFAQEQKAEPLERFTMSKSGCWMVSFLWGQIGIGRRRMPGRLS